MKCMYSKSLCWDPKEYERNPFRLPVNTDFNELSLWSRVVLETLLDTKLVNKFQVFHFLLHHSLALRLYSEPEESSSHCHTLFNMQYLRPSLLLSGLFLSAILVKISHVFLIAPMRAKCSAHPILICLILGEGYCHVYECDYRRGFVLMTGFIGIFDTARDYTL
jgi:hypothetical protein